MNLYENLRLAIYSLVANKLRALLTMLGIIIGVAAVITLLSVGKSVESFVVAEFEGLGNNLLFVFPGQFEPGQGPVQPHGGGLTNDDVAALSDSLRAPDLVAVIPQMDRLALVTRGGNETRTTISGTTAEFPAVRNFYPIAGNFFSEQDDNSNARVAVMGQTVYETLFPDGELPIGETIKINNTSFRIVGLLEEKGGSGFNDQDNLIIIPLNTAQKRLFPSRRPDGKFRVDLIFGQAISDERQDAAIAQIQSVLRETHDIDIGDEDDFTVLSQDELIGALSQITNILTIFLSLIAGISLLVGGIGIMNIMLVSVRERTREIGLRKAVGAKSANILWQFLVEAMVLAIIGGILGLALGLAGSLTIASFSADLQPTLAWDSVVVAIGFSGGVGLFFGIFPASRAARLNPIDALRYE